MSGEVDRRVGRVPWRGALGGKASFFLATASALAAYRNKAVRVAADGAVVYEGRARLAVIGNGRFAGGGMMVAPTAELDDGLLDLVVLPDVGVGEVIRHIAKIYQGSHLSVDKVLHRRARRIEAFSEEETLLDVDGEAPGRLPASFEVMPRALRLAY
jgi:diacylglycerol kinase family enzyme